MIKIIFIFFCLIKVLNGQVVAPFQVSIRGDLHTFNDLYRASTSVGNNSEINLCNGVIIHEKFILTTASCLHIKPYKPYTNISKPMSPWMVYIVAGYICNTNYVNNTCYNKNNNKTTMNIPLSVNIKRSVISIVIHDSYDPVTYANDIALLKLDRSLPLNGNMNISWIDLYSDNNNKLDNCFTITRDNNNNNYLFIRNNVTLMHNSYCNKTNGLFKPNDICSQYILDMDYNCGPFGDNLKYSLDVASSLVCNNKLIGLLSSINSPLSDLTVNCFAKRQTTAFYINITQYIMWINTEMGGQQIRLDEPNKTGNGGLGGASTSLSNSSKNTGGTVINHYYYGGGSTGSPPYSSSEQPPLKKAFAPSNINKINSLYFIIIILSLLNL